MCVDARETHEVKARDVIEKLIDKHNLYYNVNSIPPSLPIPAHLPILLRSISTLSYHHFIKEFIQWLQMVHSYQNC